MSDPAVFKRYAYSSVDNDYVTSTGQYDTPATNLVTFTGGDLQAYINNMKVGNLESITWSVSVETVGNYVMGRRDPQTYTTGKRVIVGSIVFSQYDRHAFLEQVWNMSSRKLDRLSQLWSMDNATAGKLMNATTLVIGPSGTTAGTPTTIAPTSNISNNTAGMRGLSKKDFENQLAQHIRTTAELIGATRLNYSDQIPAFDLTLVGVSKAGYAARCAIFGMQITQETAGFSMNDLGNSVGMSYVALGVSPWRAIELGSTGMPQTPSI